MAKFEVVHHVQHNGDMYEPGESIELDVKKHKQLIESGAVKEAAVIVVPKEEKKEEKK